MKLIKFVREHVLSRFIIVTNEWKGYSRVIYYYDHYTVNHSENNVNLETQATINTIEGT